MGGYSFNKSHSALYAVMSLQTAYLKAHYPVYFYKALLNLNKNDYGILNKYIIDAKNQGIEIFPPNINKSDKDFIVYDGKILFGLQAIKGIGEKFVEQILEEREKGKFLNFEDFKKRINPTTSQIIALVKSGAIPTKNKKTFLINYAKSLFKTKEYVPVNSLPKLHVLKNEWGIDIDKITDKQTRLEIYNNKRKEKFLQEQQIKFNKHMQDFINKYLQDEMFWEFETLSIFINNNPFEKIYNIITPFNEIKDNEKCVIVGIVANIIKKKDRNGKQFAFLSIYSAFGLAEVTCWHTQYKTYQDLLKRGNQLALLCKKNEDKLIVESIKIYDQWLKDKNIK